MPGILGSIPECVKSIAFTFALTDRPAGDILVFFYVEAFNGSNVEMGNQTRGGRKVGLYDLTVRKAELY